MPKYIPPRHKLGQLSNHDKRMEYINNDANWVTIESSDSLKIQQLKYTPYVRTMLRTHCMHILGFSWQQLTIHNLNTDESIGVQLHTINDIKEYLKQQAWNYKQEKKGV